MASLCIPFVFEERGVFPSRFARRFRSRFASLHSYPSTVNMTGKDWKYWNAHVSLACVVKTGVRSLWNAGRKVVFRVCAFLPIRPALPDAENVDAKLFHVHAASQEVHRETVFQWSGDATTTYVRFAATVRRYGKIPDRAFFVA